MKKYNLLIKALLALVFLSIFFLSFELYTAYKENQGDVMPVDEPEKVDFNYSLIPLEESLNRSEYIILDVREPEEYFARHVKGALNVRLGDIQRNEKKLNYLKNISGNKTFATYCHENRYTRVGDGRSGMATQFLLDNNLSAVVIEGGMREFLFKRSVINENYFYSLGKFIFYSYPAQEIDYSESSCVARFAKNKTLIQTQDQSINLSVNSGFMTTHEWGEIMNIIGNNTCTAECVDRPTCFYARLFGMRLDLQGGQFKGFVVVSD